MVPVSASRIFGHQKFPLLYKNNIDLFYFSAGEQTNLLIRYITDTCIFFLSSLQVFWRHAHFRRSYCIIVLLSVPSCGNRNHYCVLCRSLGHYTGNYLGHYTGNYLGYYSGNYLSQYSGLSCLIYKLLNTVHRKVNINL